MTELDELKEAFRSVSWLQELPSEHLSKLYDVAHLITLADGDELFREGDQEDSLYIIVDGRIAIEIYVPGRGRIRIHTAEPMEIVGWSAITPFVRQRTASARALSPSRLIAFDAARLRQLCGEDHDLGFVMMHRLADVVASRLLKTRLQLLDMFDHATKEEE